MSDQPYEVDGVTITPKGGGVYELAHEKLSEPVTERGKEKAEERAKQMAQSWADAGTATMQGQPSELPQGQPAQEAPKAPEISQATQDDKEAENATLRAKLAEMEKQRDDLLKAAEKTVATVEAIAPPESEGQVPAGIPREFTADMDDETVKQMKKMGVGVTRIVLEENENIPPTGLFVGHNGRGYMIQAGVELWVPDFLLEVLDHAVMAAPITDGKTMKVLGYRNRMRYPYRVVKG